MVPIEVLELLARVSMGLRLPATNPSMISFAPEASENSSTAVLAVLVPSGRTQASALNTPPVPTVARLPRSA